MIVVFEVMAIAFVMHLKCKSPWAVLFESPTEPAVTQHSNLIREHSLLASEFQSVTIEDQANFIEMLHLNRRPTAHLDHQLLASGYHPGSG